MGECHCAASLLHFEPIEHQNKKTFKHKRSVCIITGIRCFDFPTLESNSWLSGGCFYRLCGKMTVNESGLSALKAPRITAAFVPEAPEVKT